MSCNGDFSNHVHFAHPHPCPTCNRCPTCGRGYYAYPAWPYYYPYPVYPAWPYMTITTYPNSWTFGTSGSASTTMTFNTSSPKPEDPEAGAVTSS